MAFPKKLSGSAAWGLFLITAIWIVVTYVPPFDFAFGLRRIISRQQRVILYHLDHASLATVLREFAAQQRWSGSQPAREPIPLRSDAPSIPVALRILKPSSIRITDDQIDLEFGGALLHYGIRVFRPGLQGSGTKQLGEGVWFYSEDGRYPSKP